VARLSAEPAWAQQPACPAAEPTYTGNCGPTFVLPAWGDAGGWTDPSQYSTIQLADIDGDRSDELLGRSDAGIQIHEFDTTVGQWRPQITANGTPALLNDFRSPLPSETPVWTQPQYYSTIQAADIDGEPGAEVLARFQDGMRVYKYAPGAGGGPGSWAMIGQRGPFSDASGWGSDPSMYSTIQTGNLMGGAAEEVFARSASGILAYRWSGSGWTTLPQLTQLGTNAEGGAQPAYYTDITTADAVPDLVPGDEVLSRSPGGVFTAALGGGRWGVVEHLPPNQLSVFEDDVNVLAVDCPFTRETQDCFGSSPSYYETMQAADIDGEPGDELLGRATDGLRVHWWAGPQSIGWLQSLPTLSDLAGPSSTPAWRYATIQTANLDGTGGEEVLALDGNGLQAWSYNPSSNSWTKLAPSVPLALSGGAWNSDPSTFSTIQTGDVDGDGRDDVIARGPYGIRTWFYNRRGTGGWERYLPEGYPAFRTAGQQAAFAELNRLAKANGDIPATATTIRDVWASASPPQPDDLTTLLNTTLPELGNCTKGGPAIPPSFGSCTPPAGSSGFTAADWTAVMNEMAAETYWAQEVLAHFAEVNSTRQSLFISEDAELPAIGNDLQLQAAANLQASYDFEQQFALVFDIIGAIAGLFPEVGPALSAAFAVTGDIMSMLPSSSDTLTSTFNTTYAGVQTQFANGVSEITNKTLPAHSQLVRQDLGLLELVGQLRSRGTWTLDEVGATSAGSQGFALWVYQTLLGAVYARYEITDCGWSEYQGFTVDCSGPSGGPGVIGGDEDFTAFGPPPAGDENSGTPCYLSGFHAEWFCTYQTVAAKLSSIIWGSVPPRCSYRPGNPNTAWTFGCSVGVSTGESATWNAPTYSGSPVVNPSEPSSGSVRGVGSRRAAVRIAARTVLPRSVNLQRARVSVDRVLHEPRGLGELLRPRLGRRLTPIALMRVGKGGRAAVRLRGKGPRGWRPRLVLRKRGRARLSLTLRMPRARMPVAPAACNALPASLQRAPRPVQLHTRLRIDDGRRRPIRLTLRPQWRCRRDRTGTIRRLSLVRPTRLKLQPGLALRLRGPRTVRPGANARFSISVRNRRAPRRGRLRSSFWNTYVRATPGPGARLAARPRRSSVRPGNVFWRIRELRGGKSRKLQIRLRVPRSGRKRVCLQTAVGADAARPASARRCARVALRISRERPRIQGAR
jgi:hypothetical protein